MGNIEQAVSFMEMIAKDDSHGYAQDNRGGSPDYDCSSLVGTALNKAGFNVNPLSTTRTLYDQLIKCGFKSIGINDKRLRGDIFLSPGHHVVMCTDDKNIVHASINEKNKTTKGTPGDQTGKEICIRTYYSPSYGWTYHLRYPQQTVSDVKKNDTTQTISTSASNQKMVDISEYNTITNYAAMVQQMKYVIIRVGRRAGESGQIVADKSFKTHIENCLANGAVVGVYFYDQSINETEAREQAEWVANMIKPYDVKLPVYIDSENTPNHDGRADTISKDQRTKNLIAFCNRIQELGYIGGVYSGNSWFQNMINFDQIKQFSIWCARYSTQKPTVPKYDIWQYGSEYYSWAAKNIDTNIIYTDLIIKNGNGGDNSKPTSTLKVSKETPILLMGKVNINNGTLNVRKTPDTNAPVVQQLNKGVYIQLRGDLGDWYRIDTGYVVKQYIKEAHGIVTADKLNVRSTPNSSLSDNVVTTLPKNTEVIVCTTSNGWYEILLSNGTLGWVSGQYLKLK